MPTAPKILCMYSGGLDSAGALWQLIHDQRYSEYEILVHHVQLLNVTNRYYAERQAVDKTIPLFRSLTGRKLYLSSTIMDFAFMAPKVPVDADVYGFVAANLANIDLNIVYIAIGRTADDETTGGDPLHHIANCVEKALSTAKIGKKNSTSASCITPVIEFTKQQIWNMLPENIRNASWSCRIPRYQQTSDGKVTAYACMRCNACLARSELK
jgi:7-cyano-7-deazaguanine synthase in queuosine biosynthesis